MQQLKPQQHIDSPSALKAEDIPVTWSMLQVGMSILEEANVWPVSYGQLERAFQAMYMCGFQESVGECNGPEE